MPTSPTITGVTPTGLIGSPDDEIEFSATVDNPDELEYTLSWNFGGGAAPDTSTALEPMVQLEAPETYEGSVQLLVDDVVVISFPFEYTVIGAPIITAVTPIDPAGLPLGEATLEAVVNGNVDEWSWTFDEAGALPDTSTDRDPTVTLQDPGRYAGTVSASNSYGTASFPFEFTVAQPSPPTWRYIDLGPAYFSDIVNGFDCQVISHEGRLVALWNAPGELRIAISKTGEPQSAADWDQYVLHQFGRVGGPKSLVSHLGRLALVFYEWPTGSLPERARMFGISTTALPLSADEWIKYDFVRSGSMTEQLLLSVVSLPEKLAVIDPHFGPAHLSYRESVGPFPESLEEWATRTDLLADAEYTATPAAIVVDGKVWVTCTRGPGISLFRAISESPEGPADWIRSQVEMIAPIFGEGRTSIPFVLDGRPAVAFGIQQLDGRHARIGLAFNSNPGFFGSFSYLDVEQDFESASTTSLVIVQSSAARLAYFYRDLTNQRLMVARQTRVIPIPSIAHPWTNAVVDQNGNTGLTVSACAHNERLVAMYGNASTARAMVAIADGPF